MTPHATAPLDPHPRDCQCADCMARHTDGANRAGEGFFYCGHCNHVIELPDDADAAQTFKCPRCKKWEVKWRFPMGPREKRKPIPVPAKSEGAQAWFQMMREAAQ